MRGHFSHQQGSGASNELSTRHIEFIAEQQMIEIRPFFELTENGGKLNCIGGDYGPFHPSTTTKVPLWLAIVLKKMHKCRILQPSWLSVQFLTAKLEQEKATEVFQEMDFHYMEIASMLFQDAANDIEDLERIRGLLEDIQNVRQDKIRNGLQRIASDVQTGGTAYAVQMNNVGALEINSVRQFMSESLNKFYSFSAKSGLEGTSANSQATAFSSQQSSQASMANSRRLRRHR